MAYGNLLGGGYSGFIKAEKPLEIKKRNYVPLRDSTSLSKYGVYSEKVPESESLLPREKAATKEKKKDKRKSIKSSKRAIKTDSDDASELENNREDAPILRRNRKTTKLDNKRRQSRRKTDFFIDERPGHHETATTDEETEKVRKPDEVTISIPETLGTPPELSESEQEARSELNIKFKRSKKKLTYTYYNRKRSVLRFCPFLNHLFHSKRNQYRGLKALLGFPIGALFGFVLYKIVLERIGAAPYYFWILGIVTGAGFAVSTQVRCICFLSIPACFGRAGRPFVSAYIVAFVIEGPFTNILVNGKEAMRSISCTASLNLNHSMERFQLMFKPVKEVVIDFVGAGNKVQKDTKQLEKTFDNIEEEVREEDEIKESMADIKQLDDEIGGESRVNIIKKKFRRKRKPEFGEVSEKKYGMKSELRCEEVFTKGVRACYDSFGKAYDKCHSYLPIIGYILCWPMKLTFICDLASSLMGKRSCDSNDVMNPGFGASVETAEEVQSEFEKDFDVQLQYKLVISEESVNQLVPEDVAGAMKYSFERRKRNLEFFAQLIDRILALLVVLVLNGSRKYCNQYLRVIQFDNKYVTSYFRHIDARRRKANKEILLPLKKAEKLELFNPFAIKFSVEEKGFMFLNILRLVSEVMAVTILLLFDWIFYQLLDIIKRHAHVTYKQTGVHHIKMTIYGDGFVGNMVRGILKGFDKKHSADQVTTTEGCLPLPTKLSTEAIIRLYLGFLIIFFLIILESYFLRLRRVICSFFYPKREKKRILFLYNDRLKKRRSFLKHMRHRVRKQARQQAIDIDSSVFCSLRKFYPKYFGWLSKLGLGRSRCIICSEAESKTCHLLSCSVCQFSYCSECWKDTEENCYVCLPDYDTEPSEDSLSDD